MGGWRRRGGDGLNPGEKVEALSLAWLCAGAARHRILGNPAASCRLLLRMSVIAVFQFNHLTRARRPRRFSSDETFLLRDQALPFCPMECANIIIRQIVMVYEARCATPRIRCRFPRHTALKNAPAVNHLDVNVGRLRTTIRSRRSIGLIAEELGLRDGATLQFRLHCELQQANVSSLGHRPDQDRANSSITLSIFSRENYGADS